MIKFKPKAYPILAIVIITSILLVHGAMRFPKITEISGEWKELHDFRGIGVSEPPGNTYTFSLQTGQGYVWKTGWPQCAKYSIKRSGDCTNCYEFVLDPDARYANVYRKFSIIAMSKEILYLEGPDYTSRLIRK